jgi:hypothetical protein
MMMQCSDLNAPKEAKGFKQKQAVKDVHILHKKQETFQESQRARRWDADTTTLSELFTLPGRRPGHFIATPFK